MRYELQVGDIVAPERLKIKVYQDANDDVNLEINGELVLWFSHKGALVIDQEDIEKFGLSLRGLAGASLRNTDQE